MWVAFVKQFARFCFCTVPACVLYRKCMAGEELGHENISTQAYSWWYFVNQLPCVII